MNVSENPPLAGAFGGSENYSFFSVGAGAGAGSGVGAGAGGVVEGAGAGVASDGAGVAGVSVVAGAAGVSTAGGAGGVGAGAGFFSPPPQPITFTANAAVRAKPRNRFMFQSSCWEQYGKHSCAEQSAPFGMVTV